MPSSDDNWPNHLRRSILRWAASLGVVGTAEWSELIGGTQSTESPTNTHTETPVKTPEESWAMYSHDHRNSGYNEATTAPTNAVDARWTFDTGGAVRSSPAVVQDTVYIGSDDGHIYALDAATGEEQWSYQTDGAVVSSPAVFQDTVYVGSDDHYVYALTAETGERIWGYETGDQVRSSPTVDTKVRDLEFNNVVGFGSDDGSVYYLNPETAEEFKTIDTGGPVVSAPMTYVTVNKLWEAGIGSADGTSYWWVPGNNSERHINTKEAEAPVYASISGPDYDPENIWYRADDGGNLVKLATTGGPIESWTFEAEGEIRTTPAVTDDLVYVGSWDANVYAIKTESGEQKWSFETGGKLDSSPAVADGTVYIGSGDKHIYALDAESGDVRWTFETGGGVVSSPAVVDGTVYIGSNDGSVYALTEPSG